MDPIQLQFGVIIVACFVSLYLETRNGITSDRMRLATVDKVPRDYVAVLSFLSGALLFVLTTGLRIAAEVQIVGVENETPPRTGARAGGVKRGKQARTERPARWSAPAAAVVSGRSRSPRRR